MNGRLWTAEDLRTLRDLYPVRPTRELAALLGRPVTGIYAAAAVRGLHKTEEFLASPESGRLKKGQTRPGCVATQFKPGQMPANKGLRRPGWAPGRMRATQFKKGQRSGIAAWNWRPIGTILPDSAGYLRIKVREALHGKEATGFGNQHVWPFLSRYVWGQHHGPVPAGHTIAFKDGDRKNCAIENLECISRSELAYRNRMWGRMPRELAEVIHLNGVLKRKLRELSDDAAKQDVRSAQPSV